MHLAGDGRRPTDAAARDSVLPAARAVQPGLAGPGRARLVTGDEPAPPEGHSSAALILARDTWIGRCTSDRRTGHWEPATFSGPGGMAPRGGRRHAASGGWPTREQPGANAARAGMQ